MAPLHAFEVSGPGLPKLKLTAKVKASYKPFESAIVEPFLKAINKKRTAALTAADLEAIMVAGVHLADPSVPVSSVVLEIVTRSQSSHA